MVELAGSKVHTEEFTFRVVGPRRLIPRPVAPRVCRIIPGGQCAAATQSQTRSKSVLNGSDTVRMRLNRVRKGTNPVQKATKLRVDAIGPGAEASAVCAEAIQIGIEPITVG